MTENRVITETMGCVLFDLMSGIPVEHVQMQLEDFVRLELYLEAEGTKRAIELYKLIHE